MWLKQKSVLLTLYHFALDILMAPDACDLLQRSPSLGSQDTPLFRVQSPPTPQFRALPPLHPAGGRPSHPPTRPAAPPGQETHRFGDSRLPWAQHGPWSQQVLVTCGLSN